MEGTPLTVIGGYLGAGKTTLLNHLLRSTTGQRLAVVVNDFGPLNIDAELIRSSNGETIALANGCICCSIADGLAGVLQELRSRRDEIDQVVVEASGVSDPVRIGQLAQPFGFALHGVIVVADAEQIRVRAEDRWVGRTVVRHLQGADLVVLNKVDLLDRVEVEATRTWVTTVAPGARVVPAVRGLVPVSVVLGVLDPPDVAEELPDESHEPYDSWFFVGREPLERETVEAFLAALPDGVVRVKGFVHLADDREQAHLLQVVGRRSSLVVQGPWSQEPATSLVAIGLPGSIHADAFDALLGGRRPVAHG